MATVNKKHMTTSGKAAPKKAAKPVPAVQRPPVKKVVGKTKKSPKPAPAAVTAKIHPKHAKGAPAKAVKPAPAAVAAKNHPKHAKGAPSKNGEARAGGGGRWASRESLDRKSRKAREAHVGQQAVGLGAQG